MIKPDTYTVDEVSKCLSQIGPYPYRLATIEEVAAFKKKHGADFIPTHVRDYPDMVKGMIPVIVARVDRSYGITSEYARLIRQRNRN